MQHSPLRHTLAVLRTIIGITQKEMAAILECSTPTIQAIELGKLRLSERLGELIALKTGVDLAWLMNNDPSLPPVTTKGLPYSNEVFEDFQAGSQFAARDNFVGLLATIELLPQTILRLAALTLRAFKDHQLPLCAYRMAKAFEDLERRFGVTPADQQLVTPDPSEQEFARVEHLAHPQSALILELFQDAVTKEAKLREKDHPSDARLLTSVEIQRDGQITYVPGSSKKRPHPEQSPPPRKARASQPPQKKETAPRKR